MGGNPGKGNRWGGRPKGVPNKSRDEVRALIAAACGEDWNPLQAMARAAQRGAFEAWDHVNDRPATNPDGSPQLVPISEKTRATLYKETSEYAFAKRKAVEISDQDGNPVQFGIGVQFVKAPTNNEQ